MPSSIPPAAPRSLGRWPRSSAGVDWSWAVGLGLMALGLFFVNLGGPALRDWDEGTVAQVAREIARNPAGLWQGLLQPTLFGLPYVNKPPLMHGLIALAYRAGGVTEVMARSPGAALTALSVPLLYGVGRSLFATRRPAVFAALAYLTMVPVVRHGRLAMLDGAILCFFMGTVWAGLRSRHQARWSWGIGLGIGLMCLTKGILGLLLGGIVLAFLAWDTPRLLRSGWLWAGIGLGLVPAIAWYAHQGLNQGSGFLEISLVDQSLKRLWQPVENHRASPLYYLGELLEWGWPWLLFVPQGLREAWRSRQQSWGKLLLLWAGGYFVVITVMQTKLPWYIMPLYPSLALAAGWVLAQAWDRGGGLGHQPYSPEPYPRAWAVGLGLMAGVAAGAVAYFIGFAPPEKAGLGLPLGVVLATSLGSLGLLRRHNAQFITVLGWGWFVAIWLLMASPHWVFELNEAVAARPLGALIERYVPPGQFVYTTNPIERPSLNFYGDRRVVPLCELGLETHPFEVESYGLIETEQAHELPWQSAPLLGESEGWQLRGPILELNKMLVQLRRHCAH